MGFFKVAGLVEDQRRKQRIEGHVPAIADDRTPQRHRHLEPVHCPHPLQPEPIYRDIVPDGNDYMHRTRARR